MNHTVQLTLRYARNAVNLTDCIAFRYEKERYTPYTELSGQWYCPKGIQIDEIVSLLFYIDGKMLHYGYPIGTEFIKKDGRTILKVSSKSYSAQLLTNQCPDGLLTDINLTSLVSQATFTITGVAYQTDTPVVNYVNYYNGTRLWDGIVCYSIRASGNYPYLSGCNTIRIDPKDDETIIEISESDMISCGSGTDYSKMLSRVSMNGIYDSETRYVAMNAIAGLRSIVRCVEQPFDREWIMNPDEGLQFKIDYSMRGFRCDSFSFFGYYDADILDRLSVNGMGFEGEIDRLVVTGNAEKGIVTSIWCYQDQFCK